MLRRITTRGVLRYVAALVASWASIGLIAMLLPNVGYLPILFVPIIVILDYNLGVGPAVVGTIVCTFGSLLLMGQRDFVPEEVHNLANLAVLPIVAATLIHFIETRKRQKAIDQERLAELSTLLESMPEAVLIFNTSGYVVDVNRAALDVSGIHRQELVGLHLRDLVERMAARGGEKPLDFANLAVVKALRGETVRNERRIFERSGALPMEAVVSASPMRDGQGNIIGALVVIRDVTEITQLQKRIADTERHLAIGQMAAGIAHDFNNVLDTISQAAAVVELRPEQTPEERKAIVRMIHKAVSRGAEIINRLREYIRGGTGEQIDVDVRRLMEEALEMTRPLWRRDDRISVVTEFSPTTPVKANPADLRRVFTNLIRNAIQAMPEGGQLTLHVGQEDGHVVAWVRDTGVGIPQDMQKNIFLPYYTTKTSGTGLGLSGAQKIIVAQRGSISFHSEPGQGTTFRVELPALVRQEQPQAA